MSGFGMGAFVFNQIQTHILNWNNYPVSDDGYFAHEDILNNVPRLLLYLGIIYASMLLIGNKLSSIQSS